jgi:hypothetical protein
VVAVQDNDKVDEEFEEFEAYKPQSEPPPEDSWPARSGEHVPKPVAVYDRPASRLPLSPLAIVVLLILIIVLGLFAFQYLV